MIYMPKAVLSPRAYLVYVLLGTHVGGMHDRAHDLGIATDHQGFIRCLCVDAHPALAHHRVGRLAPLPVDLTVILKLTRV